MNSSGSPLSWISLAPAQEVAGPAIVAGQHPHQVVIDAIEPRQIRNVTLSDLQVVAGFMQAVGVHADRR